MPIDWIEQDQSTEESVLRQTVRRFVSEFVNPLAIEMKKDRISTRRKLMLKAGELGILGLALPKGVGGQGATVAQEGIADEEMGRSLVIGFDNPVPLARGSYTMFSELCPKHLVDKWMPKFLRGETTMGAMSTEPRSGSELAATTTTATKVGDKFVLNGEKGPISHMHHRDAFFAIARTGAKDSGIKGLSIFFVEADSPGMEKYYFDTMDESADLGGYRLKNVEVPTDHLMGGEGTAFANWMSVLDSDRATGSMQHLGAAMDSLESTVEYSKSRVIWGRPVASYEGVMFPLVESITKLESARSFCYQVLRNIDEKKRMTKESAMIHWYVPKLCLEAIDNCIQVNGAQGFTDLVPHQGRYRWIRGALIGHGTQEIQKLIIGREVMGSEIYRLAIGR